MGKKILVIALNFYPEQFRINDICLEWIKRGYDVTVITGIPNYPQGRFYDGYGLFKKRKENYQGIKIKRLFTIPRGKTKIGIILNYYSFLMSGFLFAKTTREKFDLIFTFGISPTFQARIANWYNKKNKIPSLLYVQDLWPENLHTIGINNVHIHNHFKKMMNKVYDKTTLILTSSQSFIDNLLAKGVKKEKLVFWPQYAESFYHLITDHNDILPMDDKKNFVFTGNLGAAQGLDVLIYATKELLDREIFNFRFVLVGNGRDKDRIINLINKENVADYFLFLGSKPAVEIPNILANAVATVLTLAPNKVLEMTIPAKFQSYLACGKPVLAAAGGEVASIIEKNKLGWVSASDYSLFADNVEKILDLTLQEEHDYQKRCLEFYDNNYSKDKLLRQLDEIIKQTMEDNNV